MDNARFNAVSQLVYKNYIGPVARALYHSHEILFADAEAYRAFEQHYKLVKIDYLNNPPTNELRFNSDPISFEQIKSGYQTALEQGKPLGSGTEEDLQEKFRWLSDYLATARKDDWYLANTAGGFWVRRSIDGTEAQIFQLLTKLLKTFDPGVVSDGIP
jgi:hypothetical protein